MELTGDEIRMSGQFHDLNQLAVRGRARDLETGPLQRFASFGIAVQLITMTMALGNQNPGRLGMSGAVQPGRQRIRFHYARIGSETHRAALLRNMFLLGHKIDDRMRRRFVELRRIRILPSHDVAREFNGRTLHSETYPEERYAAFARIPDCRDLAAHATAAEPARNENAVNALEELFRPRFLIRLKLFGLYALDMHLAAVRHTGMVQRLVNGLVCIANGGVLADQRYRALPLRLRRLLHQRIPDRVPDRPDVQAQLLKDLFIQMLHVQFTGNRVDGIRHVPLFDNPLGPHVAEEREFLEMLLRDRHFRTADKDIGNDADCAELAYRMLRGFGLQFPRGL